MIDKIVKKLNKKFNINKVDIAVVVGSGLLDAVMPLENKIEVSYAKLKMPASKVAGHSGKFVFGTYKDKTVVLVSRIHFYEHGQINLVRMPFEIIKRLGVTDCVLLTSSGGLNKTFAVGDVMLITDHINCTANNPLVAISPMTFTPMANCYDKEYITKILDIAKDNNLNLKQGTHLQFSGPSYETLKEVEYARMIGGDTVSMSTVYDCIICNWLQMKVCAMASVVNVFEDNAQPLSHQEVLDNAQKACNTIKTILTNLF